MHAELVDRIDVKATLGEGVIWDHRTGQALWTDIQERRFYRYEPSVRALHRLDLGERLTAFGLSEKPDWLIAAFESGFAWFNGKTGELQWINRPEEGATGRRFNDGRVGPCGRFWCGTMVEDRETAGSETGCLYRLNTERKISSVFGGISIANSLCWSPDGAVMYFADSSKRTIWAFDYDVKSGAVANKRVFAETPEDIYPDGAVVDGSGYLWSAQWGGSCVARYTPDGRMDSSIPIPTSQPSCVAFGGDDLDLLFVTTARENLACKTLKVEPHAGDVFVYKTDCRGVLSTVFGAAPP